MCGIAAACTEDAERGRLAVEAMCEQMLARGPDDHGIEVFAGRDGPPVVLGSRRLAIIDPSPAGHQPMVDPERETAVVFNGMVYNFGELRERLQREGERFASSCDTEVLLKAYGHYGADCVRHLEGMFAFAVWDGRRRELFLARDPLGIKPLYYTVHGGGLLVASQVKALLASGLVEPALDAAAIRSYLAYGAISEPATAIEGVSALPAGHRAVFRDGALTVDRYWQPPLRADLALSRENAARELRRLLEESVRRHLISDAPLGVFLSGGVDSSVVAALASRHTAQLRTHSVVFDDPELSEAEYSRLVASHVGSDHVEVPLRANDLLAWLDDAFDAMDQPTFDGINTYVVSRAAGGSRLKVALSGLGADELFNGYGYVGRAAALERARRLPAPVRALAARAAAAAGVGSRAKLEDWLRGDGSVDSYDLLRRLFSQDEVEQLGREGAGYAVLPAYAGELDGDVFNRLSVLDLTNYMKNVLLRDTDAMSMCHSLEVRVPFLDQPLVDWVLRLPGSVKGRRRKSLLLAAVGDTVPEPVLSRRKQGFALPLARWMRGELKDEVEETLREPPEELADAIDRDAVGRVWDEYLAGDTRWLRPWSLYALSRWSRSLATAPSPVG